MSRWDLVIVGGGPVGLVTALAARQRGLSAVVVEQNPGLPEKACGEGLMPGGVAALAELDVRLEGGIAFRGIRFIDAAVEAAAPFPEQSGLGMNRRQLVRGLAEHAAARGVELLSGHTLREFDYRGRVLHATVQSSRGEKLRLEGQLLVAADGLRSGVRRRLGYELPARRPPRFGLSRHYACAPWSDCVEVHWQDGAEAYVTPLGPAEVGVALLSHGAPAPYDVLLGRFPRIGSALGSSSAPGRVRGAGPFEQRVQSVLAPGVALVGDASGYLDAVSGEGLALGFRCALQLVERFAAGELWRYPRDHARLTSRYHALTLLMLEIAQRPRLRSAIIRRLGQRPRLFSDLLGIASESRAAPSSALGAVLGWSLRHAVPWV